MYLWVVKSPLYSSLISKNEILRIGNTKIAGLILPRLWSMLVWERYSRHLPPSCCDGSDFPPPIAPAGTGPLVRPPPTLLEN